MSLSQALASFVVNTRYDDLSIEEVEYTKLCILDWLGSALAGQKKEPVQIIDKVIKESGGAPQASLITGDGKTSVINAALVNGAASHIVELDDIHKASIIHAGTVVIPAALAIAEWKKKSGKDLITAIAIGYDVCYRIGEAVSPSHYYYWHNTGTCGTFGAAAAAAKLLDLNEEQVEHTLGSAGTQAAGLWEFIEDGAMSKQLHPGKAAMNGVLSALLSQQGFTAARKILEGKRGFFQSMSSNYDQEKIIIGLGQYYKIVENSFKIHASCRHTHPAIDLVVQVVKEKILKPEDIRSIRVKGYRAVVDITDNPNPTTIYASKFSTQFCTALALIKGSAGLNDFNEETLHDPVIRQLMSKVQVVLDKEIDAEYPDKWGSVLEIELTDGEVICVKTDYPKGDPENPVSAEELMDKFRAMTQDLSKEIVEEYITKVMRIEQYADLSLFFPREISGGVR